jgi:hypothetical protein
LLLLQETLLSMINSSVINFDKDIINRVV